MPVAQTRRLALCLGGLKVVELHPNEQTDALVHWKRGIPSCASLECENPLLPSARSDERLGRTSIAGNDVVASARRVCLFSA